MDYIVKLASGFTGLFDEGAKVFVSWVGGIVPKVLLLLVFMNALVAFIGPHRVEKFAKVCSKNVILAYGILPFVSAFMLAIRYLLVGLVMNFFAGWVTDFTTKIVMKQQKIELSNELKA